MILRRLFVLALLATAAALPAQSPQRPRITGISHVAYFVTDLPKALAFWHDFLGYDESYALPRTSRPDTTGAVIKLNDHQSIELFTNGSIQPPNFMSHLSFAVDDMQAMRAFLLSQGYKVGPDGSKNLAGDYSVEIRDPNGMLIEFVQSLPTGLEAQAAGRFLPASRISPRIYHAGYLVGDAQKTETFYKRLGFTETWRGGANPNELSWINLKVPDGDDYVELMLYRTLPDTGWGTRNHLSLVVQDIAKAVTELQSRPYFATYGKPLDIHTGVNQKRQVNLYDPDGTRVELMEPITMTGQPTPSSTAPPPPASPDPPFGPPALR